MRYLLLLALLCALAAAYSGGYSSEEHHHHHHHHKKQKPKCPKLEHYQVPITNKNSAKTYDKEPTYSHFKKNGKWFIRISCPNESTKQILIARQTGKKLQIGTVTFEAADSSALAAGFNVQYIAECDGDHISGFTTDKRKINIDKVACVSVEYFQGQL